MPPHSRKLDRNLQTKILNKLRENNFHIGNACECYKLPRRSYCFWVNNDPWFRDQIQEIRESAYDDVESMIKKKLDEGDNTMLIFYAKTKMKSRGYVERQEITHDVDKLPDVKIVLQDDEE